MELSEIKRITQQIQNFPLVYVAGPFRSKDGTRTIDNTEVVENICKAQEVAATLWQAGFAVLCPHANSSFMADPKNDDDKITAEQYYHGDFKMLMSCDAIYMIDGWQQSQGAIGEMEFAKSLGMPVYGTGAIDDLIADKDKLVKYPNQFLAFRILNAMQYYLHVRKNYDYSPQNILGTGGVGIATRIWDKVARYLNLVGFNIKTGEYTAPKEPKNESVDDTLIDLSNYGIIGLLEKNGLWAE